MVKDYLARSLTFFRDAKQECEEALIFFQNNDFNSVALVGQGDLADIVQLVFRGTAISTRVINLTDNIGSFDAVIITDIVHPQQTYDLIKNKIDQNHIITPNLLHISRGQQ